MAAWDDLPSELLISISNCLDILSCLRFSAVCTTWASTVRPRLPTLPSFRLDQRIPWLLIYADISKYNPDHTDFTFYDLTTATSHSIHSPIPFSSFNSSYWLSSNCSWLACIDQESQLHLISSLNGVQLLLPPIKLPDGYHGKTYSWEAQKNCSLGWDSHKKVIIFWVPDHSYGNHTGLMLLCLFCPKGLAFLKVGDDKWTWLDLENKFMDATFYQGRIYATEANNLHCWELKGSTFIAGKVRATRNSKFKRLKKYLVESEDKLLMVCRKEYGNKDPMSVYELHCEKSGWRYSSVKSLGDNAAFIGIGYSRLALVVGLDHTQGNCIYYTDDDDFICKFPFNLSGVYNLKKQTFEQFSVACRSPAWFWPCDVK